jgi:hypothetical protein
VCTGFANVQPAIKSLAPAIMARARATTHIKRMTTTISPLRLNLLRLAYLLLVAGLGSIIWPAILDPTLSWPLMSGVVKCMLAALSALAVLGLRYPLKMLPLLFFEIAWKVIWLTRIALPQWTAGTLDEATTQSLFECAALVILLPLIPWDHVYRTYLTTPGDPWFRRREA